MTSWPKTHLFKSVALVLAFLIGLPAPALLAQAPDRLQQNYDLARQAYFDGHLVLARELLEELLPQLFEADDRGRLAGEASLLAGAVYEGLELKAEALFNYCQAKEILGSGRTIDGLDLESLSWYAEPCPEKSPETVIEAETIEEDLFLVRFSGAKKIFFAGNYQQAKNDLEMLIADIENLAGRDSFKGEVYLLAGATYEKLKFRELAFKYFCQAKSILGKGRTIEGLKLKDYKQYKKDCPDGTVYAKAAGRKKGGGFLGALLGLAVLAGAAYLVYTKFIKKDEEDTPAPVYYENEYQAWTCWHASATAQNTTVTPQINSNYAPNPSFSNNYDDQSTCTITGENIVHWSVGITITACNGLTRRDQVFINGSQVLDVSNTYNKSCAGGPGISDFCNSPHDYSAQKDFHQFEVASGSGQASFTIRHKITFTRPSGEKVVLETNRTLETVIK